MLIGYARVSTQDQNLELQREALSKAGCKKVFEDKVSGTRADRPGLAKTLEMLREVLPRVETRRSTEAPSQPMRSPGMLAKHYSPRAPLTLYEGERAAMQARIAADACAAMSAGQFVGILAADEDPVFEGRVVRVGSETQLETVASRLYAALRELDGAGVDVILVRSFPAESGMGVAIQDRLRRAAAGRIVKVA